MIKDGISVEGKVGRDRIKFVSELHCGPLIIDIINNIAFMEHRGSRWTCVRPNGDLVWEHVLGDRKKWNQSKYVLFWGASESKIWKYVDMTAKWLLRFD